MYNIYVTNKAHDIAFVRLESTAMGGVAGFVDKMEDLRKGINSENQVEIQTRLTSHLVQGGFRSIPPAENTIYFPVHDMGTAMYASLAGRFNLWVVNFPVYPKRYGCISIKSFVDRDTDRTVLDFAPFNPRPVWIKACEEDDVPRDSIKAGKISGEGKVYFGRSASFNGLPCKITSGGKKFRKWIHSTGEALHGEYLKDTGYELVRAKRGDPIPPNAVSTGVPDAEGTVYVGRVGGSFPCSIITEDDKIKCFSHYTSEDKQTDNGEVLVLTDKNEIRFIDFNLMHDFLKKR